MNPENNNISPAPTPPDTTTPPAVASQPLPVAPVQPAATQPLVVPASAGPIPAVITPPGVQSYSGVSYNTALPKNSSKLPIIIVGAIVFLLLAVGGMGAFLFMNGADKQVNVSVPSAQPSPKAADQQVATPQPDTTKTIQQPIKTTGYPANLRAIYVNACNPGDRSACNCEVDYFEKNLPVEDFRNAMENSKESAAYNDVFDRAFVACDK